MEAKSGQTITSDVTATGRKVEVALSTRHKTDRIAIYGGDSDQLRSDMTVLTWKSIDNRCWS